MSTPNGEEQQVQTALRLDKSLLDRLDRLAERMSQPGMRITRTAVLRLALVRGLDQLEKGAKSK